MKRSVPPKMTSAIENASPRTNARPAMALSIADSIASCDPHPAWPSLNGQPAAFAMAPGSMTDGAKSDHRRYVARAGSSTRGASRPYACRSAR